MAFKKQMAFRIDSTDKKSFETTCRKAHRVPSDVLREIIVAFNENRIRIAVPKTNKLEIYNEH